MRYSQTLAPAEFELASDLTPSLRRSPLRSKQTCASCLALRDVLWEGPTPPPRSLPKFGTAANRRGVPKNEPACAGARGARGPEPVAPMEGPGEQDRGD